MNEHPVPWLEVFVFEQADVDDSGYSRHVRTGKVLVCLNHLDQLAWDSKAHSAASF
jgi:hypothetical protein